MTKFEERVREVVRRETEFLQQQMLDLEAAPDLELESSIEVIHNSVADMKDEMMNYFNKVLGDLATVKKSTKGKGKTSKSAEFQQLNDHCDRELIDQVKEAVLASRPKTGLTSGNLFGYSNLWTDFGTRLSLEDLHASPDMVDMAKRMALSKCLEWLKGLDKVSNSIKGKVTKLTNLAQTISHDMTDVFNRLKKLDSKVEEGNSCCASQTQFLENVLYPEVLSISGGSGSQRSELSVIKGQLAEIRRLLR